jgi:hypothetical protein
LRLEKQGLRGTVGGIATAQRLAAGAVVGVEVTVP